MQEPQPLGVHLAEKIIDASCVAARLAQACDKPELYWVLPNSEYDGDCRGCSLRSERGCDKADMAAARSAQFSIQKCDILSIPDVVRGAGEAMRRREFIAFVGRGAAVWPLTARAQQAALPVVGVVSGQSPHSDARNVTAFYTGLGEAGYVDGQNVTVEYHWVEGHYDQLPAVMADLVRRQVAVIATTGNNVPKADSRTAASKPVLGEVLPNLRQ